MICTTNNDSFVFGHPLGSVKDVNADCPQDNGDTFFGNMGKIVSKLKTIEPNARIFVVTPQLRGEACDNDIRYIASELAKLCDMFEFTYLLDMTAHAPVYDALLDNPHMFAFCYTQLYDVEQELNGLYTYERKPKFDMDVIKAINARKAAIED